MKRGHPVFCSLFQLSHLAFQLKNKFITTHGYLETWSLEIGNENGNLESVFGKLGNYSSD